MAAGGGEGTSGTSGTGGGGKRGIFNIASYFSTSTGTRNRNKKVSTVHKI